MTAELPERIWAIDNGDCRWTTREDSVHLAVCGGAQYVRADTINEEVRDLKEQIRSCNKLTQEWFDAYHEQNGHLLKAERLLKDANRELEKHRKRVE